jgi:hypothetical protein
MWAVVLAVHRLGLEPIETDWCISNYDGNALLEPGPKLIHYCYSGDGFDKHAFDSEQAAMHDVWRVPKDDGTISGAIRGQLRAAGEFYRMVVEFTA